jgi:putative hydrolase of the HAD superfamily
MLPTLDIRPIEAILFDMNGTLRMREPHPETQRAAFARLRQLLGKDDASDTYWEELTHRQKAYTRWAQENLTQLSEADIWTQWILPDAPPEQIEPVAPELMLAWAERKGRVIPKPGAGKTLMALKQRGYHLGVLSNTMSMLDIPRNLGNFGWSDLFDVVALSAELKIRKPAPGAFLEVARRMGIPPMHCAYLGNRISKDIVGCKRAGFALGIVLEPAEGPRPDELDPTVKPDLVIHSLPELLDIFPARSGKASRLRQERNKP